MQLMYEHNDRRIEKSVNKYGLSPTSPTFEYIFFLEFHTKQNK